MNVNHLEERVASAEAWALQISLTNAGPEAVELDEAWQNINRLENETTKHACERGQRLSHRLASIRAELDSISRQDYSAKPTLSPIAA